MSMQESGDWNVRIRRLLPRVIIIACGCDGSRLIHVCAAIEFGAGQFDRLSSAYSVEKLASGVERKILRSLREIPTKGGRGQARTRLARRAVVDAARTLFLDRGYAATTIEAISEQRLATTSWSTILTTISCFEE